MSEEDFEFDFIAAATEAAVEREDRESSEAASRVEPIVAKTTTATRTPVAPQPSTSLTTTDDDYEFDFIAAATQAAIERENREPQYRVDTDESSFKVFPAVDPLANVMWAGQENKALLRSE
jgi:heme-binding NEAT domain protein